MLFTENEIFVLSEKDYLPANVFFVLGTANRLTFYQVLDQERLNLADPDDIKQSLGRLLEAYLIIMDHDSYRLSQRGHEVFNPFLDLLWGDTLAHSHYKRRKET